MFALNIGERSCEGKHVLDFRRTKWTGSIYRANRFQCGIQLDDTVEVDQSTFIFHNSLPTNGKKFFCNVGSRGAKVIEITGSHHCIECLVVINLEIEDSGHNGDELESETNRGTIAEIRIGIKGVCQDAT